MGIPTGALILSRSAGDTPDSLEDGSDLSPATDQADVTGTGLDGSRKGQFVMLVASRDHHDAGVPRHGDSVEAFPKVFAEHLIGEWKSFRISEISPVIDDRDSPVESR